MFTLNTQLLCWDKRKVVLRGASHYGYFLKSIPISTQFESAYHFYKT